MIDSHKVKRVYLGTDDGKHIEFVPVSSGCEYCSGDKAEYQSTPYAKLNIETILDKKSLVVECSLCPPYVDCCMKCTPVRSVFKINYCPNCGAKMNLKEIPSNE